MYNKLDTEFEEIEKELGKAIQKRKTEWQEDGRSTEALWRGDKGNEKQCSNYKEKMKAMSKNLEKQIKVTKKTRKYSQAQEQIKKLNTDMQSSRIL